MKEYLIEENDADQRLDKFLKKLFPRAVNSLIYKINRKGKIKIILTSGQKTKQDNEYKLQVGQKIQVFLPDHEIRELQQNTLPQPLSKRRENSALEKKDIVYEDGDILVINKNPGQNVHPGDHKSDEVSLIQQVHDYLGDRLSSLTFKPSLVHRIDRDTSGIIVIAKTKPSLVTLSNDFKKKEKLKKIYYTIVAGKLSRSSGSIKKSLKRIENAKNQNKVQVSDTGQEAVTHYKLIEEFQVRTGDQLQTLSALEVHIETGRMHQIRVHMAHIGNPVLGDKSYGDKKLNSYFSRGFNITRQMLHAWKFEFTHPRTQKKMCLEARKKKDMIQLINMLKK